MKEARLKYFFFSISGLILILMLYASRDAGISCDEILHYDHSVKVLDFYISGGKDKAALDTPVTHLQYYGQSYDNIVTAIISWLQIEDVYTFRHLMSSIAGWLAMLITALFAVWLSGYWAGLLVLLLFFISPSFIGHTLNNLKDIPFALAYIGAIFFALKFLKERRVKITSILFLVLSIAFAISIRAGGLILICYLYFFFFVFSFLDYLREGKINTNKIVSGFLLITSISLVSWILGILFWPYALQNPFINVLESYRVMAHFPDTFRQIFEGKTEWSDFMPWYYLPKSMTITIPLIVLAGFILSLIFLLKRFKDEKAILYALVLFTIIFPMVFVIVEKSNLYSSWRQFLFLYPSIVLLAAIGIQSGIRNMKNKYLKWALIGAIAGLTIHPLSFMVNNHPYHYLYFNQLAGGLKGAYANYETDYYFVSQTEASQWLTDHLKNERINDTVKVKATYSVHWLFRDHPNIQTSYFRYSERSQEDWDYAIVVNRYISPFHLTEKIWPPANTIHTIEVEGVPVCAIIKRQTKSDYYGYRALNEGRIKEAIGNFEDALRADDKDELIFYNFATALYSDGQYQKADSALMKGLEVNPDFEPVLMYLGNIAVAQNKPDEAIRYYERLISANRKYFEAYVELAKLFTDMDLQKARNLLRTCLTMNPGYKPAIVALADTYRISDPGIAEKYDELAKQFK